MKAMRVARVVVLISGSGSNLQAIIDACASGALAAQVALVVSNRRDAYGLVRAKEAGIPTLYFPLKPYSVDGRGRRAYDADLAQRIAVYEPDVICLAGWMHIFSNEFLRHFPGKIINLHPALPGQFPGTHSIERSYEAFKRGEITHTGVMIHHVPDEGVDVGPVILSEIVPIHPTDTLADLEARLHAVEHRLYAQTIRDMISAN